MPPAVTVPDENRLWQRHTLVFLTPQGRRRALKTLQILSPDFPVSEAEHLLLNECVPAIVRRQESPSPDCLQVGFSSPETRDGVRLRANTEVPFSTVTRRLEPWQIPSLALPDFPHRPLLAALLRCGERCGLRVGVFGSAALHIVTGLPYLRPGSDLDLTLTPIVSTPDLSAFGDHLRRLQAGHGIPIDAEVQLADFGVKLKEYLSGSATVLGKGFHRVALLRRLPDGSLLELPPD